MDFNGKAEPLQPGPDRGVEIMADIGLVFSLLRCAGDRHETGETVTEAATVEEVEGLATAPSRLPMPANLPRPVLEHSCGGCAVSPPDRPARQAPDVPVYECGHPESNRDSLSRFRFSSHFGFRRRPEGAFVVWTIPSPYLEDQGLGAARLVSTPSPRPGGLVRDWLELMPLAFPEFERFYSEGFPPGTPTKSDASTCSAMPAHLGSIHQMTCPRTLKLPLIVANPAAA